MARNMRQWMSRSWSGAIKPRPTAPWLVMTTTGVFIPRRSASARSAPGRNSNSAQLLTWSGRRRLITPSRSRKTAGTGLSAKQGLAGGDGDGVLQDRVTVLDHPVVVARNMDRGIDRLQHASTGESHQADRPRPHQARGANRRDDIWRVAAGADRDHDVTRVEHIGELLGEDPLVRGVVRPGGEQRDVIGEGGDAEPGSALDDGGLGEVAGEVARIGRAAAIADHVDVAARIVGIEDDADHALDRADRDPAQHRTDFVDVVFEYGRQGRGAPHQLHRMLSSSSHAY